MGTGSRGKEDHQSPWTDLCFHHMDGPKIPEENQVTKSILGRRPKTFEAIGR